MHQRKIQLIAGSTYTVSLPKDWVKKAKLKEKATVLIEEKDDMTLMIHPSEPEKSDDINEATIVIDEFKDDIRNIIYSIYYLGIENIKLISKNKIEPALRNEIKKSISQMTGTEIVYEDHNSMNIKVLLDQGKVNVEQLFFRVSLIIGSSITSMLESPNMKEIQANENEIDRLYNLLAKTLHLSSADSVMLKTSGIEKTTYIIPYIIISKKMENMGDNVKKLADYCINADDTIEHKKEIENILPFIKERLSRAINFLMNRKDKVFSNTQKEIMQEMMEKANELKDPKVGFHLNNLIRILEDIEEAVVNLSFYRNYRNIIN